MKSSRIFILACLFSALASIALEATPFGLGPKKDIGSEVRIGVLANRGHEICMRDWQPTADYLSAHLSPITFVIVPLGFDEIIDAVRSSSVCYIVANPAYYAYMERHGLARRIATRQVQGDIEPHSYFGGVIFTRADRQDLQTLPDLRGARFAAVDGISFGGWLVAKREFTEAGLRPEALFSSLEFTGAHDEVAVRVLAGQVDAGTVRSTQLERMAQEGLLDLDSIRVINSTADTAPHYPYLLSTRLYPEWPFAALPCSPNDLNKRISIALLEMSEVSFEAQMIESAGWTIPEDYAPVHELLQTLQLPPYESYGKVSLWEAIRQHWIPSTIIAVLLLALIIVLFSIGVAHSKLRQTQHLLQESHEDLTLAHKEVTEAAAEAQRANRVKTQFITNISHEIRTPLNAIINFAIMLKGSLPDAKSQRQAEIIHSSGQMLLRLISDVLDLSLIESGRFSIKPVPIQVDQILHEIIDMFRPKALEKNVALKLTALTPLPQEALIDPLRFRQVIINLMGNAVKFTDHGSVELRASAERCASQSEQYDITVEVIDTGIGISEDFLPYLFEAFVQAPDIDHSRHGGTGLGLTIASQILSCMNGSISVKKNATGQGTHFTVVLSSVPAKGLTEAEPVRRPTEEDSPNTQLDAAIIRPALGKELIREIEIAQNALHVATVRGLGHKIKAAGEELSSDELAGIGAEIIAAADVFDVTRMRSLLASLTN